MKANSRLRPEAEGELGVKWMTTGQVARRLGVSCRTVQKWIDAGWLVGLQLPHSLDRRVHPAALKEFEDRNGFTRARGGK